MKQSTVVIFLLLLLALRFILLEYPGLIDPTEGRYAYVAQEMAISGDWVTPKLPSSEGAVPYLGKPPLHFWMTAISLTVFGMDEWSARLPSFFSLLVICWCTWTIAKRFLTDRRHFLAPLIVVSSGVGFITSGTVSVDLTLTAGITLAVTGYLSWRQSSEKVWSYLIFIGLALAFLTKGPVAIALFAFPVLALEFPFSKKRLLRSNGLLRLPWFTGILLFLAIIVPWFVICEIRNPGFLKYFFVNENLLRFLVSDYGDRYGNGHKYPFGSSWWMFGVGFLPWTPLLIYTIFLHRKTVGNILKDLINSNEDANFLTKFLFFWMFAPILIFTFSKQLHIGYIVPALPAASLLLARLLNLDESIAVCKSLLTSVLLFSFLSLVLFGIGISGFASHELIRISLLPLALGTFSLYYAQRHRHSVPSLFIGVSLSFVVTLSLVLTTFAGAIGDMSSTAGILDCRSRDSLDKTPDVTVFGGSNYSASYYSRAWQTEFDREVKVNVLQDIHQSLGMSTDLIMRDNTLDDRTLEMKDDYDIMAGGGRWVWLHRKGEPMQLSDCDLSKPFGFLDFYKKAWVEFTKP